MRRTISVLGLLIGVGLSSQSVLLFSGGLANAQVIPDGSLPTTVTSSGGNFTIDGGAGSGNNLFHSFSQFSVPTGGSAFFNNAATIQNIFARVTGGNFSNIDGLIKANGSANLFLLNPAGILFGPNAQLNIGGSFIGTTASSIKFADGTEFSATNGSTSPLLTMSTPVGLQMGANPGAITVQGPGNRLIDATGFGQASAVNSPAGLQAGTNQTLALIGGTVNFSGGVASIKRSGHLEVGSVNSGSVGLTAAPTGWVGDYSAVTQFSDVHLAQQSMLNASGTNGSIQIQGQNISLSEGSAVLLQNIVGPGSSGGITLNARGSLTLTGYTASGELGSLIQSNNFAVGQVGDVSISAANLSLLDGARIITRTRNPFAGANVITNVSGTTEISGFNRNNPAIFTAIATFAPSSTGNAGNITISTKNLRILDSGAVISLAINSGQSGTIQVNAAEQVEIAGYNPVAFSESSLNTDTQGVGSANRAVINTARLVIRDGGSLGSTTTANGSAGNVEVNASEYIDVQGRATQGNGAGTISRIYSNAELISSTSQSAFKIPDLLTGNAGSLTINTPSLRLRDGGAVSVKNDGIGIAGNVQIKANSVLLENQSSITAAAQSGGGGNISLQANTLIQRHGSLISATTGGTGNGGNVTINAPLVVAVPKENSDIVANAVQGRGGNVQIITQGIFGLQYRPFLTPLSDITASSQFGVSGTVQINTISVDPNSGLVKLPANFVDSSQKISTSCSGTQGSSFTATGRGGIPQNPTQAVMDDRAWTDLRDLSAYHNLGNPVAQTPVSQPPLMQATTWQPNPDGTVKLIATRPAATMPPFATCSGLATAATPSSH